MVDSVSNNISPTSVAQVKNAAETGFIQNFDTFLKLLTVQLQNQDPLSPLDTNEFTNQIATFSQVEQAISANKKLDELIQQNANSEISSSVNYVGKSVEAATGDFVLQNGGQKSFAYELSDNAEDVQIVIKNEAGQVVYQGEGTKTKGRNDITWDRLDGNGNFLPAGKYSVTVNAQYKGADAAVPVKVLNTGVISGVIMDGNQISSLLVDGVLEIPLDDVEFVGISPAANTNAAPVITDFAGEVSYGVTGGPLTVDDNISLFDQDGDTLSGVVVALDGIKNSGKEFLNVTLEEGINIESNKDGILVLTGVATKEAYQRVLRSLTYENTAGVPNTENRQISIITSDGLSTSNKVTKTVKYNVV